MTVLDSLLYEEARLLDKRASNEFLSDDKLIESLAFARDAIRRTEEDYSAKTKAIKAQLKPYDDARKSLLATLKGAAESLESSILAQLYKVKMDKLVSKSGVEITVARLPRVGLKEGYGWRGDSVDTEYLLPMEQCIDWALVKKDLAAGVRIDFAKQYNYVSLRTKLPEVIE